MTFAGRKHTPETLAKISAALRGEKHPQYGKPAPNRGKPMSEEQRAKLSGERNHNYDKPLSAEQKAKLSASRVGEKHPLYGKPRSEETRAKISVALRGENNPNYGKPMSEEQRAKLSGERNHSWRGGISFEPYCPKFNDDLKRRIRAFFENQCVMCGSSNASGYALSCHHCTYDKNMCCDGKPVRFAALCIRHHNMTNGGDRQRWENMLHRVIDEIYDGRSYFTKEEYAEVTA